MQFLRISQTLLLASLLVPAFQPSVAQSISWHGANIVFDQQITALAVKDDGTLFAGAVRSDPLSFANIFRSADGGSSFVGFWIPVSNPTYPASAILAMGDGSILAAQFGVWRSNDDGNTWTLTSSGLPLSRIVQVLAADSAGALYAGMSGAIFRSADNGASWLVRNTGLVNKEVNVIFTRSDGAVFAGTRGEVYRWVDTTFSWLQVAAVPTGRITCMAEAGSGILYAGADSGLFASSDSGGHWNSVFAGYPVCALTVTQANNLIVGTAADGIFRSTNSGIDWTQVLADIQISPRSLISDRTGKLSVGTTMGMYQSLDAGITWMKSGRGLADAEVTNIAVTPLRECGYALSRGRLYRSPVVDFWGMTNAGMGDTTINCLATLGTSRVVTGTTSGKVYRSTDSGLHWLDASSGLPGSPVHALAFASLSTLLAGTADGVCRSIDSGKTWSSASNGLSQTDVRALAMLGQNLYAGTVGGGVFRSTDNGTSWTPASGGLGSVTVSFLKITPGGAVVAGTDPFGVYVTTNLGANWSSVTSGLGGSMIRALAVNSMDGIIVSTDQGVFRSTDFGQTWSPANSGLPTTDVMSLAITPADELYAGTKGYGPYRTDSSTIVVPTFSPRWLDIGSLQSWYSASGAEIEEGRMQDMQDGLRWPAQYAYQDMEASKGIWIGTKNYGEVYGPYYPVKVVHVGPRINGTGEFFPTTMEVVGKFPTPSVTVDGRVTYNPDTYSPTERVDSTMRAEKMIHNVVNTAIGVTVDRRIFTFSQPPDDNYIVHDYRFTNTGNLDANRYIEAPNQILDSVYFYFLNRYAICADVRYVIGNATGWGINTMLDARGDGVKSDPPGQNFRAQYAWHGKFPPFTQYDNIGGPMWHPYYDQTDTTGRLGAAQFVGVVTLHADHSTTDSTDDPGQPSTTSWEGSDEPNTSGNSQFDTTKMRSEYTWIARGHKSPRHADAVEPSGAFDQPTYDPAMGTPGGFSAATAYGPYHMGQGETVHIVFAEAVAGLSREKCISVGAAFKKGVISAKAKNDSVLTGRDSLFQVFQRALASYGSGFSNPADLRPPISLAVTGLDSAITLSWQPDPGGTQPSAGFRIYRSLESWKGSYTKIHETGPGVTFFADSSALPEHLYFYYVTSYASTGKESSRFYTQTYDPVWVHRPAGIKDQQQGNLPTVYALHQNFPNPFNPSTTIRYDLPYVSRVHAEVFNIFGQRVTTLVDGVEGAGFRSVSFDASRYASGVYFCRLQAIAVGQQRGSFTAVVKLISLK